MINVKVEGLKELNAQLKRLTGRKAKNILRAGTRAAAAQYKKEILKRLPSRHKKKIDIQSSRRESTQTRHVFNVGVLAKHWQLVFLEYGTKPHDITPKRKKILISTHGDNFVSKKVSHPGVKKLAFMRRSFQQSKNAEKAFIKRVKQRINKELK